MKAELSPRDVCDLVAFLRNSMEERREALTDLDSQIGDGDMGVTIALMFRAMTKAAAHAQEDTLSQLLMRLSEAVAENAPSTFGTLCAAMFKAMSAAADGHAAVNAPLFADMLSDAADAVMARGKASPGDKTLLDALVPAAKAAAGAKTLAQGVELAAKAAAEGAASTESMAARTGRAGYLNEKSIGFRDPGAEAIANMLSACLTYITE